MPISLRAASSGSTGFPVGSTVIFPDNLPVSVVDREVTWLRSGYIETNPANFNATYWGHTRSTLWRNAHTISNRAINGVSANGSTFVAAVDTDGATAGGLIVSTDDGLSWGSIITPSGLTGVNGVTAVKWVTSLSLWIAVSNNGLIWTSTNTSTWTSRTSGTINSLNAINFANGVVVIVGASGTILTSTNATSYTVRTSNVTAALLSVAFYNNVWLAVGTSTTSQSSRSTDNGVTWTATTTAGGGTNDSRVSTGNNLFVLAVREGSVYTSTTGNTGTWNLAISSVTGIINVSYNGEFYILGVENPASLYKTFDLTNLRRNTGGSGGNASIAFLNISEGRFLATGSDNGSGSGRVIVGNLLAYAGSPSEYGTSPNNFGGIPSISYVRIK